MLGKPTNLLHRSVKYIAQLWPYCRKWAKNKRQNTLYNIRRVRFSPYGCGSPNSKLLWPSGQRCNMNLAYRGLRRTTRIFFRFGTKRNIKDNLICFFLLLFYQSMTKFLVGNNSPISFFGSQLGKSKKYNLFFRTYLLVQDSIYSCFRTSIFT